MQLVQEQDEHSPEQQLQEQGDILIVVDIEVNRNDIISLGCWICIISDQSPRSFEDAPVEREVRPILYFSAHQLSISMLVSKLTLDCHPFPVSYLSILSGLHKEKANSIVSVVESKCTSSASPSHLRPLHLRAIRINRLDNSELVHQWGKSFFSGFLKSPGLHHRLKHTSSYRPRRLRSVFFRRCLPSMQIGFLMLYADQAAGRAWIDWVRADVDDVAVSGRSVPLHNIPRSKSALMRRG